MKYLQPLGALYLWGQDPRQEGRKQAKEKRMSLAAFHETETVCKNSENQDWPQEATNINTESGF